MLVQLHVHKQSVKSKVVSQAESTSHQESDPESITGGQESGDGRSNHSSQRTQRARNPHNRRSFLRLHNSGDESRARCLIHIVETSAYEEQDDRHPEVRWQAEEEHSRGGWYVGEDHGIDQADPAG
jgi:hypothetical protein